MVKAKASSKTVERKLHVFIDMGDDSELRLVGELVLDEDAPGGFAARFQYAQSWVLSPDGFPLDPLNMPLGLDPIETTSKYIKLGALFDAAPDLWGRRVLQAETGQAFTPEGEILLKGRGNGVGCLFFATSPSLQRVHLPVFETLPTVEHDLGLVHEAVHQVEINAPLPPHLQGLLGGSWSMGGAQPKAIMRDEATGDIWLAKFTLAGAPVDRARVEWANLMMAKAIGLPVSESYVVDTRMGSVLLTRRFDRDSSLHRTHYVSAISLVSAEPEDKRMTSARDQAIFSYAKVADVARRVCADPRAAAMGVFARMVLNVCVRNTDDHLKNLGFVQAQGRTRRMQFDLAPVFDVVTQASPSHFLTIGTQGRQGTIENALSGARDFGLSEKGAQKIVDRVVHVVSQRQAFYARAGLSQKDQDALNQLIEGRCPTAAEVTKEVRTLVEAMPSWDDRVRTTPVDHMLERG